MKYEGQNQDRLLAALAELPHERASALANLTELLTEHGEGFATISLRHADGSLTLAGSIDPRLKPGEEIPPDGVVALAAREGRTVYLEDARSHPNYRYLGGLGFPVELALPIFERGTVTAVLNIEGERPLSEAQRRTLQVFVRGVGHQLTQASHSLEAHLTSELSSRLTEAASPESAAETALKLITEAAGAKSSTLMSERRALS